MKMEDPRIGLAAIWMITSSDMHGTVKVPFGPVCLWITLMLVIVLKIAMLMETSSSMILKIAPQTQLLVIISLPDI